MSRIASRDLASRILTAEICRHSWQTGPQIKEWAEAGEVTAFSPLAMVRGVATRDYEVPKDVWRTLARHGSDFGYFDVTAGRVDVYRVPFRLSAPRIEFELSENIAALIAVVETKRAQPKKPHPSSLEAADAPLVQEMRRLIATGEVEGPYPAALHVVDKAEGAGTVESKISRLMKRYRESFR